VPLNQQGDVGFYGHYPLERIKLPENMLPEYPHAAAICGKRLRDERLCPYPRTEYSVKVNHQEYFALNTHMDDQIGRILKALKETGQADSTYIVFTAAHGLACGHHGLLGKQNMYDHSVRVPFYELATHCCDLVMALPSLLRMLLFFAVLSFSVVASASENHGCLPSRQIPLEGA
jgi:hypothetical protein